MASASGEQRAAEAAKKSICSPLLETSIDGARGVIMNITGGTNLSLYEVNEAADIVTSAAHQEVNMIFGAVINEDLKDEIVVTVIATGFDHQEEERGKQRKPQFKLEEEGVDRNVVIQPFNPDLDDNLEIPTFLRFRQKK